MNSGIRRASGSRRTAARTCLVLFSLLVLATLRFAVARLRMEDGIPVFQPYEVEPLKTWECPRHCEDLFGKLRDSPTDDRGKIQELNITERGEPKSGTGYMMKKATEALAHFCHYLQRAYGQESCRVEIPDRLARKLIFKPELRIDDSEAPCSCENIDRVTIELSAMLKHSLPVDRHDCSWSHPGSTMDPFKTICRPPDVSPEPENRDALWRCIKNTPCAINDDSLQMAILRDPREVTVSTFYYWTRFSPKILERFSSMDDFFVVVFPALCKWLSVRFLLFEELLGDQSSVFWYEDAVSNPIGWISQFFSFAGLNVPTAVLDETVHAHDEGGLNLGFSVQKLDDHPNGTISRSYKDEVSAEVIEHVDDILRQWLPPAFLDRIGVSNSGLP